MHKVMQKPWCTCNPQPFPAWAGSLWLRLIQQAFGSRPPMAWGQREAMLSWLSTTVSTSQKPRTAFWNQRPCWFQLCNGWIELVQTCLHCLGKPKQLLVTKGCHKGNILMASVQRLWQQITPDSQLINRLLSVMSTRSFLLQTGQSLHLGSGWCRQPKGCRHRLADFEHCGAAGKTQLRFGETLKTFRIVFYSKREWKTINDSITC